jgi:hypothetical protein
MNNKISENWLELLPAYGRDYKNAKSVIADFNNGKDFQLASIMYGGQYCSKNDFAPGTAVILRYNRQTKTAVIKIK